MAKLSAHGSEIGTIYYVTTAKRYMSDGVVLKNHGFGWKIHGKIKPIRSPQTAFANAKLLLEEHLSKFPSYAAYRKELHAMAGLSKRWKLHAAVSMMPDDADGVWSETCDGYGDNVSADVDEVAHLCMLYKLAVDESKSERIAA